MALHCPLRWILHTWRRSISVAKLCDHRTCTSTSSRIEGSARTLLVLDVDGEKERFNLKITHTQTHTNTHTLFPSNISPSPLCSLVLCVTLFTSRGLFSYCVFLFFIFSPAWLFCSVRDLACGVWGGRQIVYPRFCSHYCLVLLSFVYFAFVSPLIVYFPFTIYMSCLSYLV